MNKNTPQEAATNFLKCWKKRNFKKMIEFTQLTWKSDKGESAKDFLENVYGFKRLIHFEILKEKTPPEFSEAIVKDIEIFIKYKLSNEIRNKKITARAICESAPYEANKNGTWGINPIGALREY